MKELDVEILQDLQEQMNYCSRLSLQYASILISSSDNITNAANSPECQQILKKLLATIIMENNVPRVLSFLSVLIRFLTEDEKADRIMEETQKVLESINLYWQDRLLNTLFNK